MRKSKSQIIFFAILIMASAMMLYRGSCREDQKELAGKILRFHVIANSDTKEDQELKLKVRDAVGGYMSEKLGQAENLKESEEIVCSDLKSIQSVAEDTVAELGYDYQVKAELAQTDFPVKTYGCYTFPAGEYEALEVTIGNGRGHNWWCVMYPNMCFTDSIYADPEEEDGVQLEKILTEEEYEKLLENHDYEIRFRYLTFLNRYFESLPEETTKEISEEDFRENETVSTGESFHE